MFSQILPNENLRPTPFHYLISLLNRHNMLLRCYTQNFDGLEELCGIPEDKIIYSHGNIKKCHCLDCKSEVSFSYCLSEISEGRAPTCQSCNSIFVKPDIIFIGETLPKEFIDHKSDMANADLMIIAGTSLTFYPFANLPCEVGNGVPRFLINNEKVRSKNGFLSNVWNWLKSFFTLFYKDYSTIFDFSSNRDWWVPGDLQETAIEIIRSLGYEEEFNQLNSQFEPYHLFYVSVSSQEP